MGGILGGGSKNQTVTNQVKLPDWVNQGGEAVFNTGAQLAGRPYPTSPAPKVAGFTPDQQSAFDLIRNSAGEWMPSMNAASGATGAGQDLVSQAAGVVGQGVNKINQAQGYIDAAGNYISGAAGTLGKAQGYTDAAAKPVGADDINAYMNPFTDDVVKSLVEKMNQQFGRQKIDQTAALTARGSRLNEDRRGVIEGINDQNNNDTMAAALANLYSGAFNSALTQGNTSRAQQLAAGGQTGSIAGQQAGLGSATAGMGGLEGSLGSSEVGAGGQLGGLGTSMAGIGGDYASLAALFPQLRGLDISQLLGSGNQQQTQNQTNLTTANNDFLNQFNYPQEQLNWLSGLLNGTQTNKTSTATSPVGTANPFAQLLGLLGTGVGAAGSAGAFA